MTVNGKTIWENCSDAPRWNAEVIRPIDKPLAASGGIAVLRGNLAPDGAVVKPSAASPQLMKHRGRAIVFDTIEQYKARINDPALNADASCVLVLRNSGPVGYPGMAEVGNMGLPPAVLKQRRHRHGADLGRQDERHRLRHRRAARLPGSGDRRPACAGARGRLHRARRRSARACISTSATRSSPAAVPNGRAPKPAQDSGYVHMYVQHVEQADKGADLDFLRGCRGHGVPRESH